MKPENNNENQFFQNPNRIINHNRVKVLIAIVAISAIIGAAKTAQLSFAGEISDEKSPFIFSTETEPHCVQPGEKLWTIADQVEGTENNIEIQATVEYINNLPENKEILKDANILHPGDIITIPESIRPR